MPKFRFFILGLLISAIVGCGTTEKQPPKESNENVTEYNKRLNVNKSPRIKKFASQQRQNTSLALPPDLLESSNETVSENYASSQKGSQQQVLPEVVGAKIISEGDNRWLEVETDAQQVWDRIANYWAEEQVPLVNFNPAAGIMETDWIEDAVVAGDGSSKVKNITKELFNRVTGQGIAHDKYLIRLERGGENLTRVYVSHRATVKKEQEGRSPKKIANFDWVQVADNPEKVAEFLQLIVLLFDASSLNAA